MSGFKHKKDKANRLKRSPLGLNPREESLQPGELAKYVGDGSKLGELIGTCGMLDREIPRPIPRTSKFDSCFPKGFLKKPRKPHPAKQKSYELAMGRAQNKFAKEHNRPVGKLSWKLPRKSLQWLADKLNKSTRQIRRYCELNLVDGAYQTKGGHWRVPSGKRALTALRNKIRKFRRKSWSRSERRIFRERAKAQATFRQIDVAMSLNQVAGIEPTIAMKASGHDEGFTMLSVTAKRILESGGRLNATAIALQLDISRASLYRYFSSDEIKVAIRSVRPSAMKANFTDDYNDTD